MVLVNKNGLQTYKSIGHVLKFVTGLLKTMKNYFSLNEKAFKKHFCYPLSY